MPKAPVSFHFSSKVAFASRTQSRSALIFWRFSRLCIRSAQSQNVHHLKLKNVPGICKVVHSATVHQELRPGANFELIERMKTETIKYFN